MGHPVVFDGVWKKFRRGETHDSLRDLVPAVVRSALGRRRQVELADFEFWALRDVSFHVAAGEALGIIGPNGAGKSTTLKLLNRLLRPTKGQCGVTGRVGALIEVVAGFHPDLTGRENIQLQAAIMGMKRAEIARKQDAIIEFAGVGEFIDTPVKRYSSGMQARLGFAIAAHLEPNVLLIDEVLAVGDGAFQSKCFDRIQELKRRGIAIVFVSHNLLAVESLCDRALVLEGGTPAYLGETRGAIDAYLTPHKGSGHGVPGGFARHGTQSVQIEAVRILNARGSEADVIPSGAPAVLEIDLRCATGPREVVVGFALLDKAGMKVTGENSTRAVAPFAMTRGAVACSRISIASLALPAGTYFLTVAVHPPQSDEVYDWHEAAYRLEIQAPAESNRSGRLALKTEWTIESSATALTA